ncbi:hypothetical protein [Nonomuraea maheshkhaliensis]|uniref:hypothetical protein n=1 Tax=Nonomuraea maheshkhaliensis TaxID=419590 RepID=UPI0031FA2E17
MEALVDVVMPWVVSVAAPETVVDADPTAVPDAAPEAVSGTVSEAAPGVAPGAVPGGVTKAVSDAALPGGRGVGVVARVRRVWARGVGSVWETAAIRPSAATPITMDSGPGRRPCSSSRQMTPSSIWSRSASDGSPVVEVVGTPVIWSA